MVIIKGLMPRQTHARSPSSLATLEFVRYIHTHTQLSSSVFKNMDKFVVYKKDEGQAKQSFSQKTITCFFFAFLLSTVSIISVIFVSTTANTSSSTQNNNTLENETSAHLLINWLATRVPTNTSLDVMIELNNTIPLPSVPPPTCCWPLFFAISKTKCLLLETHLAHCASQKHKRCANPIVIKQCTVSGLRPPPGYTCENLICCKAMIASCLSCSYGVPVATFCRCKPETPGC